MKSNRNTLSYIMNVVGIQKLYILALLVMEVLLGITTVILALFMRNVIDEAVKGDENGFWMALAAFVGIIVFLIVVKAIERFVDEYARSGYENAFKRRLFGAILRGDYEKTSQVHSGEWMNRLTSDTMIVADNLTTIVPGTAGLFVKLIGALVVIIIIEPRLAYILIPGGILIVGFTYVFRKVMKRLHKNVQEADGRSRSYMQENIGSLMVVKAFAVEENAVENAADRMAQHRSARMKRMELSNVCNVAFTAAIYVVYVVGLAYGGYGILKGTVTYGTLMALIQLIGQIQNPFANLSGFLPRYYAMIASAERLLEAEKLIDNTDKGIKVENTGEKLIELKDVSFSYDDNKVIDKYSLAINEGEFIAFTGESGCGKSTLLKLLLGLYKAQEGDIVMAKAPQELCAYVPQGNHLMSGTIREVVALGDKNAMTNEARIKAALMTACGEFVMDLPDGIDTQLGEKGAGLSEGQMQRIAIARAIFVGRPVLILDESTSALDEETEKRLLDNLKAMKDQTVLIVTHRPAALKVCDRQINMIRG